MNKLVVLALVAPAAWAQTPANHPMPDGSRDMYVGLGVQSAPRYDGATDRKTSALPILQVEWSNGIFVSGMRAGMHWSDSPTLEFGPLLALLPRRDASGTGAGVDGIGVGIGTSSFAPMPSLASTHAKAAPLAGLDDIGMRLTGGGFLNAYPDPAWRLSAAVLYGSGRARNGTRLELDAQRLALDAGERHQLTFSAGVTVTDRNDNQSYFGVTQDEAARSRFAPYAPGGGLRDVHAGVRWNWTLTPSWLLTTSVQGRRLLGGAARSPLAERPAGVTVSTAFGYRF